ncbi:MAG: Hpt domain-containing protein [Oscillospiraceae bacterium]|nr:Hpt domain-containing protein [Oscillospiraceae bacterium]
MDYDVLKKNGIKVEEGIRRFGGKQELYEKYLLKFPQEEVFSLLQTAMKEQCYKDAFFQAHTLKGVSGNLSLTPLYECLCDFVECLREEKNLSEAQRLFPQVEQAYKSCVEVICLATM